MRDFNEDTATAAVIARMAGHQPAPARVMAALVKHLHAFVERGPADAGGMDAAIDFLTKTGQICATSGRSSSCSPTRSASPCWSTRSTTASRRARPRTPSSARSMSPARRRPDGRHHLARRQRRALPLRGPRASTRRQADRGRPLDVWQTTRDGFYDVQQPGQPEWNIRGIFMTGADGRYSFRTVKPSPTRSRRRPGRPDAAAIGPPPDAPGPHALHRHGAGLRDGRRPTSSSPATTTSTPTLFRREGQPHRAVRAARRPGRGEEARTEESVLHRRARIPPRPPEILTGSDAARAFAS